MLKTTTNKKCFKKTLLTTNVKLCINKLKLFLICLDINTFQHKSQTQTSETPNNMSLV